MQLEKQVTSLELSKQLKTLGVSQDSLFWWGKFGNNKPEIYHDQDTVGCFGDGYSSKTKMIASAFTVAELGEMLPFSWHTRKLSKNGGYYCVHPGDSFNEFGVTEADYRAKKLIYLIEEGIISI